jgi:hypothetical protein
MSIYAPINLTLTDKTSGGLTLQKTLHLGVLSGPLSMYSHLYFHSSGPQTVTLGPTTYKINFVSDTIHPTSWFLSQGRLNFDISDPPTAPRSGAASEPYSLVLAGIGVPLLGVFLRRRRI